MTAHSFATLQEAFNLFCEIKDHPRPDINEWEKLPEEEMAQWAEQLSVKGQVVIDLLREMRECHLFAPYESMKTFFRKDVTELQTSLRARHIDLNFS